MLFFLANLGEWREEFKTVPIKNSKHVYTTAACLLPLAGQCSDYSLSSIWYHNWKIADTHTLSLREYFKSCIVF